MLVPAAWDRPPRVGIQVAGVPGERVDGFGPCAPASVRGRHFMPNHRSWGTIQARLLSTPRAVPSAAIVPLSGHWPRGRFDGSGS